MTNERKQRAIGKFGLRRGKRKKYVTRESVTEAYKTACRLRSSGRWRRLRAVYLSKYPVCQDCGQRAAIEVHHIIGVAERPDFAFAEDNLRALCIPCHESRHKNNGGKTNGGTRD